MALTYISRNDHLQNFINQVQSSPYLSIDTEFKREKAYWPELCLIQIACDLGSAIIDPLSKEIDINLLKPLLLNSKTLKILHAGRQDLEIFYNLWGQIPTPLFDTQVAAMVTNFGESISYEKLTESLLNIKLDKSQQHTSWNLRPLSSAQLSYALSDVLHLNDIRHKLTERAGSKIKWIEDELSILQDPTTYICNPKLAWKKIKASPHSSPKFWGRLRALAAWRDLLAQKKNLPRGHILKDDILVDMATKNTDCLETQLLGHPQARAFLENNPSLVSALKWHPFSPDTSDSKTQNPILFDFLKILLKHQSAVAQIAPKLIATKEDLNQFLLNPHESKLAKGWRYEIFGAHAEKLLEGRLALYLTKGRQVQIKEI